MKGTGSWLAEGLHGGPLLGACGSSFVVLWDWKSGEIVHRIDADAKSEALSFHFHLGCNEALKHSL